MTECPKCGGANITGPTYCDGDGRRSCSQSWNSMSHKEHLEYRCDQCGYRKSGPTKDQRPAAADGARE